MARESEFGADLLPSGVQGLENADEKLRFAMRTEQDPDAPRDVTAKPDRMEHGGIPEETWPEWWKDIRK